MNDPVHITLPPGVYPIEPVLHAERSRLAQEIRLAAMDILDEKECIDMPENLFDLYVRAMNHAADIVQRGGR